jgi:hypothetical protein
VNSHACSVAPSNSTIANIAKQEGDPKPKSYAQPTTSASTSDGAGVGFGLYAIILLGGALAFGAYKYLQGQSQQEVSI